MEFGSDNNAGAAPEIIAAIGKANDGPSPSYGSDPIMDRVRDRIRALFEAPEAAVYLVGTGTAANALSLSVNCAPWGTVYCHPNAHAETDECGAPEFYIGGGKLKLVAGGHGKMTPDALAAAISDTPQGDVHAPQRGMVTLTNLTEAGTAYSPAEVAALTGVARKFALPVHMDGSRFANAIMATGSTPADMTWRAGIDILSFGGTKNGCLGVEAVVIFDPAKAWEFELRRKRGGHLFSKHRYLSAQIEAYLDGGLWLRLAAHANEKAKRLADGIAALPHVDFIHPPAANMLFVSMARAIHRRALQSGAHYYLHPFAASLDGLDDERLDARLVCSWCTTDKEVDSFLELIGDQG